ncbi:MAG: glutamine--fructose-6-phosphate transaminase (isomerizing), partial [Clostridiales bacterium]|nr:glutamine--fructose-6-phosphate transaminase (isomerizing) [Clostridiales bacterium]
HTRWATHGRPSDENSHPHTDCLGKIAVVHNGIIENYLELKEFLLAEGHIFTSETDTEVIAHLLEHFYEGDLPFALNQAAKLLRGSFAIVALCQDSPNLLAAARKDSPLIIGLGEGEFFFASDIPALISHTRDIIIMEDGETAVLTRQGAQVYFDMQPVSKEIQRISWDVSAAQKGGYEHFMLKEICEQPWALRQTLKGRVSPDMRGVEFSEFAMSREELERVSRVFIVACGTSYHAGMVGKYFMEKLLRLPVEIDIASEFRHRDPIIDKNTLVLVISQSGETADTIAALRESKSRGARVLAITNVLGSSIAREADDVIFTWAGPEIAVASTKAYITQLMALYLLTLYFAQTLGHLTPEELRPVIKALYRLPNQVQEIIDRLSPQIKELSRKFNGHENTFFIGRGLDYAAALEGALKLKEISYIHAEAYAAGELKHGPLALIVDGLPVLALCTQKDVLEKSVSNVKEVKARDAYVIALAFADNESIRDCADDVLYLPPAPDFLSPILTVAPLQLLAYYAAVSRGCDVDQPRNLAKSVTVT